MMIMIVNWILAIILKYAATATIGFSGQTTTDMTYATITNGMRKHRIDKWEVNADYGFYNYNVFDKENNCIHLRMNGIYLISANIILKTLSINVQNIIEISVEQGDFENVIFCKAVAELTANSKDNVALSCFTRFMTETMLSITLRNSQEVSVLARSSLSVQYFGLISNLAAFSLPLSNVSTSESEKELPVNLEARNYKYFNSLKHISNLANIKIPCSGIYILSLNAILSITDKSVFILSVNKKHVLFNATVVHLKQGMVSILRSIQLDKDDLLILELQDVAIMDESIYSLVRIGDTEEVRGFYLPLAPIRKSDIIKNGNGKLTPNFSGSFPPPYYYNKAFELSDGCKIVIQESGIYFFTISLELSPNAQETSVYIYSTGGYTDSEDEYSYRQINKANRITLSGLLYLSSYSDITLHINPASSYNKTQNNHLSMTKMIFRNFAASASTLKYKSNPIVCNNEWVTLTGFSAKLNTNLHLNQFVKSNHFAVTSSGIYFITVETTVRHSNHVIQSVLLALVSKNYDGELKRVATSIVIVKKKQPTISIRQILKLKKNDSLLIQVSCNKSIEFIHPVKFEVIALRNMEDETYLEATSSMKGFKSLKSNNSTYLKAPASGMFLISLHRLIKFHNLQNKSLKVSMSVLKNKNEKNKLSSVKYLNYDEMQNSGTLTAHIVGLMRMTKNDLIEVSPPIVMKAQRNGKKFHVYVLEEKLVCVSLENFNFSQYGFITSQNSKMLFTFENSEQTIDNFNTPAVFKSDQVRFFGPSFIVNKPTFILYDITVELQDAIGEFRIQLKIRPRSDEVVHLTELISLQSKDNITLKAFGVMILELGESVELIIYGDVKNSMIISSHRSWSVIELQDPSSRKHRQHLIGKQVTPIDDKNTGGYMQLFHAQENEYSPPLKVRLVTNRYAPANISTISTKLPLQADTFDLSGKSNMHSFERAYEIDMAFDMNQIMVESTYMLSPCVMTFIQFELIDLILFDVTVLLNSLSHSDVVFSSSQVRYSIFLNLCLHGNETLKIISKHSMRCKDMTDLNFSYRENLPNKINTKTISNYTIAKILNKTILKEIALCTITSTFILIGNINNLEVFSGIIEKNTNIILTDQKSARIMEWAVDKIPYFRSSGGLKPTNGLFILPESGYYLISTHILFGHASKYKCMLVIAIGGSTVIIFSKNITEDAITFVDIVWLQQYSFFEMQVKCDIQRKSISIKQNSTFSIMLIDSQPSFPSRCNNVEELSVESNIRPKKLNLAFNSSLELRCFSKNNLVGDFTWIKNDQEIYKIRGSREAFKMLENVTEKNNGIYVCKMERGSQVRETPSIYIKIVDHRPRIVKSNATIYVGEEYSSNKLLGWMTVEAKNVKTNQLAKVRATIIEGNEDNNFYIEPSVSKSHMSLMFHRPFDYEEKDFYHLKIRVENLEYNGTGSKKTVGVAIHVINVNEHRPILVTNQTRLTIKENSKIGTKIFTFRAKDEDKNSTITYEMKDTLESNLFKLNKYTGELSVNGNIDYEICDEYYLMVCASDTVHNTCLQVQVIVIDQNDNKPYFIKDTYIVKLTKLSQPGSTILTLQAGDKDEGGNSLLHFIMISGNASYFKIEGYDIKLVKTPSESKTFSLLIGVTDKNGSEASQNASVTINFDKSSSGLRKSHSNLNLKNWEFWILPCLGTIVIILIVTIAATSWKYKRPKTRGKRNSFLFYVGKPAETQEETMYISCGSLPAAYISAEDINKLNTSSHHKKNSIAINRGNGYSTFLLDDNNDVFPDEL